MSRRRSLRRLVLLLALVQGAFGAAASSRAVQDAVPAPAREFTVLISNDDGIDEHGLAALVDAVRPLGRIVVAAPTDNQSGTGNALPGSRDAITVATRTDQAGVTWHGIGATPTACVLLAITTLMSRPPDLVLSGINSSPNLGQSVYDSGTVGASRAGAWMGVPAISVSVNGGTRERYRRAAGFTRRLVERLRGSALLAPGLLLKVSWPRDEPKGLRITRISQRYHRVSFEPCRDAAAGSCFNLRRERLADDDPATDTGALADGYVSITPLELDVTAPGPHDRLLALEAAWDQLRVP